MARSRDDLYAGGIFLALGAYFAIEARTYELGTPFRMGPGFLPLVLGGVLALLGVAIAVIGLRKAAAGAPAEAKHPPSFRAIGLIVIAIAFFAICIRGLGFVPTVFIAALVTAFASQMTRLPGALAIATGLTVLSTLVFVVGLRLQVPLIGPWVPLGG